MSDSTRRLVCCLLTYNRFDYAKATVEAFFKNVKRKPHLHIADDGSPDGYVKELAQLAKKLGAYGVTTTNSERGGYGRNVNLATQIVHQIADYVVMLEDDWKLFKPLDLDEYIDDFENIPEIDCIRLGYLSWTQPMWGHLRCGTGHKYLLLDGNSPEPHVFAGHPRMERVSYQREVGEWPEGLDPNQTEFSVAHNRRARTGVAWPLGLDPNEGYGMFCHIGSERAR